MVGGKERGSVASSRADLSVSSSIVTVDGATVASHLTDQTRWARLHDPGTISALSELSTSTAIGFGARSTLDRARSSRSGGSRCSGGSGSGMGSRGSGSRCSGGGLSSGSGTTASGSAVQVGTDSGGIVGATISVGISLGSIPYI